MRIMRILLVPLLLLAMHDIALARGGGGRGGGFGGGGGRSISVGGGGGFGHASAPLPHVSIGSGSSTPRASSHFDDGAARALRQQHSAETYERAHPTQESPRPAPRKYEDMGLGYPRTVPQTRESESASPPIARSSPPIAAPSGGERTVIVHDNSSSNWFLWWYVLTHNDRHSDGYARQASPPIAASPGSSGTWGGSPSVQTQSDSGGFPLFKTIMWILIGAAFIYFVFFFKFTVRRPA